MDDSLPHLALPLRVENGGFAFNEQDTDDEGATCVKAILSFAKDTRLEDPEFGIIDPTFDTQPIDTDDMRMAIKTYEPRVQFSIQTTDQPDGSTTVTVQVSMPTSDEEV